MRKVLVSAGDGKFEWIEKDHVLSHKSNRNLPINSDPTLDQYIADKGGIVSHLDNKIYTNKRDYLASIKDAGCHIKDY